MNAGETKNVETKSFGTVKLWNWNDKELHFTWTKVIGGRKYEEKGVLNTVSGQNDNVPQALMNEVFAAL